ncbi:hypothetical protein RFX30_14970, partial [Acinetobacter baumannii]|nr:hypothetical protein [Acinetobacter baumannii]
MPAVMPDSGYFCAPCGAHFLRRFSSTLARDLKIFEEFNYIAEKACAVDLFPRTKHVETVVK